MSEDICWISQIRAQQFIPMWSVHFSWWGVHLCHWKLHLQRLLSFSFSLHGNVARSPDYQTADPLSINSYPGTCHKNAHKIQLGPKALNNRTGIISSRLHQSTPGNPYISAPSCNIFKACSRLRPLICSCCWAVCQRSSWKTSCEISCRSSSSAGWTLAAWCCLLDAWWLHYGLMQKLYHMAFTTNLNLMAFKKW